MLGKSALEQMSLAISDLKRIIEKEKHSRDELVDLAAKLGQAEKHIHDQQETLKAAIKTSLIQDDKTIAEGENFIAVLTPINKTFLLTDKVKEFLGKKLDQFTDTRTEKHLTFKPKV